MQFALNNNKRILAGEDNIKKAQCPLCASLVIAKCGQIKIHHWAHESLEDCDSWSESETLWHRNWKNIFPQETQEKCFTNLIGEKHRADVATNKIIIEFQSSALAVEELVKRNSFYLALNYKVVWVYNITSLFKETFIIYEFDVKKLYFTFKWKYAWRSFLWHNVEQPNELVFLDIGNPKYILEINKIHYNNKKPWEGWGSLIPIEDFKEEILNY